MKAAGEADQVHDGADVCGVGSGSRERGVTRGVDEVGAGAVRERGDERLGMAVVEQGLAAGLGEAVILQVERALEAVGIRLQVEGAGEQVGVLLERFAVAWRDLLHCVEILFDAALFEAGFRKILRGADEDAGSTLDGGAEGAEVAAGFRRQKEDGLLRLVRDRDGDAFFANFFVPGFYAKEPVIGRRVGGAAKKGSDEQVVRGLAGGEVGVKPDPVAGLEIWHGSDRKHDAAAGDANVDPGTGQIEAGLCARRNARKQKYY